MASVSKTISKGGSGVFLGDCLSLIREIPDNSIDLILSDIPYGIGADEWDVLHSNRNMAYGGASPAQLKSSGFKKRGKPINGWSEADKKIPKEYYDWCMTWAPEWTRVLKPGGSAFVFAGRRLAHRAVSALEDAGLNLRDILGWERDKALHRAQRLSVVFERRGDLKTAEKWYGWRIGNLKPVFEPIIWAFKPYKMTIADNVLEYNLGAYNQEKLRENIGNKNNIFAVNSKKSDTGLHIAQKPEFLMRLLIELVTLKGQTVLDPFAGSGTTGVVAADLGRNYIMFERDKQSYNIIADRLADRQKFASERCC
ncbi:MAG: site-specific DNA-methyltransferase [Rhodospirillaceae bacterium]|nr:site-specific DNA-methyltransferase [Rhodospirillaceae bacterium]|tara:strand:+ start:1875 stop:2807 length:933 start_codon:yes stop_codon:yes gene_type:complete